MHIGFSWLTQYIGYISFASIGAATIALIISFLFIILGKNTPRAKGIFVGLLIGLAAGAGGTFLASNQGYIRYDAQIKALQQVADQAYFEGQRSIDCR